MRIVIVPDVHFSVNSSIVRSRGNEFSTRLEHLIDSVNWVENIVVKEDDLVVYLGDFFDLPTLSAEEISAFSHIKFNKDCCCRYVLCGNHEMGSSTHYLTSADMFSNVSYTEVIKCPQIMDFEDKTVMFLPYILEKDRKELSEYVKMLGRPDVIFSHNDIANIQYGSFISKEGFTVDEIEANCELFVNGHIHNESWITKKILNAGSLSGNSFNNDAYKYEHCVWVLDTDTMNVEKRVNPYALNFIKIDFTEDVNYVKVKNAVVSASCYESQIEEINELLSDAIAVRLNIKSKESNLDEVEQTIDLKLDHLKEFRDFMLENVDCDKELLLSELSEVLS